MPNFTGVSAIPRFSTGSRAFHASTAACRALNPLVSSSRATSPPRMKSSTGMW